MYQADEIDPETIHLTVDAPVRENLEGLIDRAQVRARLHDCYVMIYHDEAQGYAIKSIDREFFERGQVMCPRQADWNFEQDNHRPRGFPSILVTPRGNVVVSKPSLCGGCVNNFRKTIFGCVGVPYQPLMDLKL